MSEYFYTKSYVKNKKWTQDKIDTLDLQAPDPKAW